MHHWKLSDEEESRKCPQLTKSMMVVSGLGGQAMEGMEQVLKSEHSPLMSSQLAVRIQHLGASEEAAAEEAGLFLRL